MRSFLLASLVTVWPAMAFAQSILPDGRIDTTPPTLDVLGAKPARKTPTPTSHRATCGDTWNCIRARAPR